MNYDKIAETSKKTLLNRSDISDVNKGLLKGFLESYETQVTSARQNIFHTHIWQFLRQTNDLTKDMHHQEIINKIFNNLNKTLSNSHYATIYSVSKMFSRYYNKGVTPEGFLNLKSPKKKTLKRELKKEDMLEWEDGLKMASSTPSIQLKAIIMTMLDGGFRPSELIDLNFGDIEWDKPFLIVQVRQGKTGARVVPLYKCVPYLKKWLNDHPTKNSKDPLWVKQHRNISGKKGITKKDIKKSDIERYQYPAIRKNIKLMGDNSEINKPLDFYNLRHSACRLAKISNMPIELAAEKFGHSTDYYVNTYGRLDIKDKLKRYSSHLELGDDNEKKQDHNVFCDTCKFVNPPKSDVCGQCSTPLTVEKALQMKSKKEKEIDDIKAKMNRFEEKMLQMFENKLKEKN